MTTIVDGNSGGNVETNGLRLPGDKPPDINGGFYQ